MSWITKWRLRQAESGTTTAGLAFGGGPPMTAATELWVADGTLSENID